MAQEDQILRGPIPAWVSPIENLPASDDVGGLVHFSYQDTQIRLDETGGQQHNAFRVRILHPQALQVGNLALSWNPALGPPTIHQLLLHRGSDTIDILDSSEFAVIRREDALEYSILTGVMTATLNVPDLRVGDELELAFTQPYADPTFRDVSYGLMFMADTPQSGRYRLRLTWEDGQRPAAMISKSAMEGARQEENQIVWQADNPDQLVLPNMAPPRYSWGRIIEFSDFPDWESVSRQSAPLYMAASTLAPGSPLKAEAERIARQFATPQDRAAAALKLVQQEIRYIFVGLAEGGFTPVNADEVWRLRYGDCKGKTVVLLALLRELGIPAEAVLVNNGGGFGLDERLPSPGMFDHVLVRAKLGDHDAWMDGTLPPVATPSREPVIDYRFVLPISEDGTALEARPWKPMRSPEEIALVEIDARAGIDKPAIYKTTQIRRGGEAFAAYAQLSALTQGQLENALRQEMRGLETLTSASFRYDEAAGVSIFTIEGTREIDWEGMDDAPSLILPGGGSYPPEKRQRPLEQDPDVPFYSSPVYDCHVTTVRVPEDFPIDNWYHNSEIDVSLFGRVNWRVYEKGDGAITMIRGVYTQQPEISTSKAAKDNMRVADFDNSMAKIYYSTAAFYGNAGNDTEAPATYEIDWTAEDVPCAPPDLLKAARETD